MHPKKNFTPLSKHHLKHLKKTKKRSIAPIIIYVLLFFIFLGTGLVALGAYFFVFNNLPSAVSLKNYKAVPLSTHLYDRNGKLLYEVYSEENRTPIKLNDLPTYVAQASVAIEDKDFYKHKGVSIFSGVLRAMRDTLQGSNLQGGSTITQQLVKSALLSSERTIQRKLKEMILALETEQTYSKKEILEMYLNQIPYGGPMYGIEEAAKGYFGIHAKDLSVAQAAMLAGLPQAPSRYSPYINAKYALQRRNDVLLKMYEQAYITKDQFDEAMAEEIKVVPPKVMIKAPHFVFYIKDQLEKEYGIEQVEEGGLKVTTTLDLDIQEKSEEIVKTELEKIKYLDVSNAAALITRPPTGEIIAMVGSYDYFASPSGSFNVTTAERQPGSTIKPINYAIGIDRKIVTPASIFLDVATCFPSPGKPYCPVNYDGKFHGAVPLRFALANSYNIPAVKMLQMNGVVNFVASASAFTITTFKDPSRYGLSLTLGGGEMKMTELNQAFSAFANQGIPKKLKGVIKITDKFGKTIYELDDPNYVKDIKRPLPAPKSLFIKGKRAISRETAFLISHILQDNGARVGAFGPNSALVIPKRSVSVKTGTTDDKRDNWTIGFTPNFLITTWVGNNDNHTMNQALTSGITGAAPIWNKLMVMMLEKQPDLPPVKPEGVVGINVCSWGGATTKSPDGTDTCQSRFEYIIKGTNSNLSQPVKQTIPVNKDTGKMTTASDPNAEMKEHTVMRDGTGLFCMDCTQ
jgi:penicillin-binding protein 1C